MSSSSSDYGGYKGHALRILEERGASPGTSVRLKTSDGLETSGIVVPRYEHADVEHIVLKLKSGYNIGIRADRIESLTVIEDLFSASMFGKKLLEAPSKNQKPAARVAVEKKDVLLLSTGGTIASRVDYRTGAVHPALSAEDLYSAVPELGEIALISPEVVFSTYSENLTPADWAKLSTEIISKATRIETLERNFAGVVVMLGTDTMAYVSAALSFSLIGLGLPVVCVGAQRSSDRPSSDAALNLKAATRFAASSNLPGVYLAMHKSENDDTIAIHSGVRVRKNHTSRRDAFETIDDELVACVTGEEISFISKIERRLSSESILLFRDKTKFDGSVSIVKFHPGFDHSVIDYHVKERGSKGLIIEGTGLGHVSSATVSKLADAVNSGVFVGMTSQCVWGRVDLNVYETGRDLMAAGVVPLENMLAETAFAKLSWVLANYEVSRAKEMMLTNLVGEFSTRIPLQSY